MIKTKHTPRRALAGLLLGAAALAACGDDQAQPQPVLEIAEGIFAEGGLGTIRNDATDEQRETFERGMKVSLHRFTPEEGLGPKFNVSFCVGCHERPAIGGSAPRYRDFYLQGQRLEDGTYIPQPLGSVSHSFGISGAPTRPRRADEVNVIARRKPIHLFGMGSMAELFEADILALADPEDTDGDGISGRPNYDQGFVGRFGRKGQTVSIEGFIRGPLNNHLGITTDPLPNDLKNRLPVPSGLDPDDPRLGTQANGLRVVRQAQAAAPATPLTDSDEIADPEMPSQDLFDLVSFAMLLGAPRPAEPTAQTERGHQVFRDVGCDDCHTETLPGADGLLPLYSDLLLHDMGEEMADGIQMALATGSEFRTMPLWGIIATGPFLHDGRADTLEQAIRAHGGEGLASRQMYERLSGAEREDLHAFLASLGGAEQMTEGLMPPNAPVPAPGEPGAPMPDLTGEQLTEWKEARRVFDRDVLVPEGLGPLFNGDSCRACHFDPVIGGSGPLDLNVMRYGVWTEDGFQAPADGQTILHRLSIPGLPRREHDSAHNAFEFRQTPPVLGLGMIEAIEEEEILSRADPEDNDGDGVRGIVPRLSDGRLGRFGWKGDVPSTREFARDALSAELGVTLPNEEGFTFGKAADDDGVADPEGGVELIEAIDFFLANTAPLSPAEEVPEGRMVFDEIGCNACHTPSMPSARGEAWLYSDLLLHDVSPPDARGFPSAGADERHFRTPPLWGMGRTAPYMHDGLASTPEAAILAHFGEGEGARRAYEQLSQADKEALLRFLRGL